MEKSYKEELFVKVPSIYKLVILASRRAVELAEGAPKLIDTKLVRPAQIALEEIRQGKVTYKIKSVK